MKRSIVLAACLFPMIAQAAPFLVSDPYPESSGQPTHCVYQEGTAPAVESVVAKDTSNRPYCKIDLSTVTKTAHTWSVWAKNEWTESLKVPFVFPAAPQSAAGLRIVP